MKPILAHLAGALTLTLAIAACVPQPESTPPVQSRPSPAPAPAPLPPPPPAYDNWMDAPQTPGDWRYAATGGKTQAVFATAAGAVRFALTCDRASRTIELSRAGAARGAAAMAVRTETATRSLAATSQSYPMPELVARLAANDRLLDAMALSKGRFAVEAAGTPTLYLPAWTEVTRVIEDCR